MPSLLIEATYGLKSQNRSFVSAIGVSEKDLGCDNMM